LFSLCRFMLLSEDACNDKIILYLLLINVSLLLL
jgi:hypothetical protein